MDLFSKRPRKKTSKVSSKYLEEKYNKQFAGASCPKGQIMRQGYTTNTGKRVSKGCIAAQSSTGKKSTEDVKKYVLSREKLQKEARDSKKGLWKT